MPNTSAVSEALHTMRELIRSVEQVIIGKRRAVELIVNALACRGHVLIEDVPGVGKTSLAAALAKSCACTFKRVQFTPDIMPGDITGFSIYNPKNGDFDYRPGAVMSQFVLADEINRASPKTQSSLLEVMEENQVTVDGVTYPVPEPFMVLATQNPVEYLGTYPLPEAQLDRFFLRVTLGYPNPHDESKMLSRFKSASPLNTLRAVADAGQIIAMQQAVDAVYVDTIINSYIVDISRCTRVMEDVMLGASPRASLYLYKSAQAWALYQGREHVIPDDIISMAPHVLTHRILLKQESRIKKLAASDVIRRALEVVRVPSI
jgi:MoxR-like ATPase